MTIRDIQVIYEDQAHEQIVKQGDDSVYDFQEVPISGEPKMDNGQSSNMQNMVQYNHQPVS